MSERRESERVTELLGAAAQRLGTVQAPDVSQIVQQAERRRLGWWGSGRRATALKDGFEGLGEGATPIDLSPDRGLRDGRTGRWSAGAGPARFALAAAGLAALVMLSGLLVRGLEGDAAGADSPEGAVRGLAEAVSAEDSLAAVRMLVPAEVRTLDGVIATAADKAEAFDLAESAARPFAGIDVEVSDLELTTEELAPGYVKVGIEGGGLSYEISPEELAGPLRRLTERSARSSGGVALDEIGCNSVDCSNRPVAPFLVAEQVDGRWFVSVAYTAFEYWRASEDLPAADFGSASRLAESGAGSPEEAVRAFADALSRLDVERMMTLVPPDELGAAYDYREAIRAALEDEGPDPAFTIDSFETEVREHVGWAEVFLTAGAGSVPMSYEDGAAAQGSWRISQGCLVVDVPPDYYFPEGFSSCPDSLREYLFPFVDTRDAPVVAVERAGRWHVSLTGTVVGALRGVVEEIDRRAVYSLLGLPELIEPDGVLTIGEPSEGKATGWFDYDVWTFSGRAGDAVTIRFEVAGGAPPTIGDPYEAGAAVEADLVGPDGEQLFWPHGYPTVLPADGDYTLIVRAYAPDGYTVTVERLDLEVLPLGGEVRRRAEESPAFFALEGSGEQVRVTGQVVESALLAVDLYVLGGDYAYAYEGSGDPAECGEENPDDPAGCEPDPGTMSIVVDTSERPRSVLAIGFYPTAGAPTVPDEGVEFVLRTEVVG